ncbi:hypothetical protein N7524_008609 [Penicillium chrysogenum]|nr:hypothetical protein N7524_008690 [Penicillium chrysogenum]KAJ5260976.1 hypothetical protein N7524_008609 [Penicillium chrysogenum]
MHRVGELFHPVTDKQAQCRFCNRSSPPGRQVKPVVKLNGRSACDEQPTDHSGGHGIFNEIGNQGIEEKTEESLFER